MKQKILLTLALLAAALTVSATDYFEVDDIGYEINGNEVTVTGSRSSGDVILPESVTYDGVTYPVTRIKYYAFAWRTNLTSIVIPNSVVTIEYGAFQECI